jgi:1-acyl-sn-glycerol-3-phosphate acyltransferase
VEPLLPEPDSIAYTALPAIGPAAPRRGNALSRGFITLLMRLFGWRIVGQAPDAPKAIFVGAPHTSNGDFFMAALTMAALGLDFRFVMKHTVFVGPVGWFLRWFGGIPLDRDRTRDFVSQMVDEFNGRDQLWLAIMPEGKRDFPKGWRSGFYYIALGAGVPLVMVAFDYERRRMRIGPTFWPTGDYAADLPIIQSYFAGYRGRRPERMMELQEEKKELV